ncbi:hypothetical protein O181_048158 [Austropuccinia psidii MF-1]|uniref:Polynucleotide 5'-hydroxyl-kinase GRC3 n=1 Tax=Austropuccinia psidii MF-1 TaxID=1389203 RepID=A0A9Q3DVA1_9BASI|nr:hypothetical protein [Austropuccinia psidii MF-1]
MHPFGSQLLRAHYAATNWDPDNDYAQLTQPTCGNFALSVILGTIEINGSKLTCQNTLSPLEIFAPSSHPLPAITSIDSNQSISSSESDSTLKSKQFSAIIQFKDSHSNIQSLDQIWSSLYHPKPSIWSSSFNVQNSFHSNTWSLILEFNPNLVALQLPSSWSNALSCLWSSNSSYFIQGSKSVGKSTMACLLINSLLNTFDRVALLDLDPGQPLLTPPSLISLHLLDSPIIGPTFCKLISPYHPNSHSIYLGHITPIDCSLHYLDATNQFLNLYLSFQPSHQNSSSIHCQRYCRHLNQRNQTKNQIKSL